MEQKNYSVVRRAVGYLRYDTQEELSVLNELYLNLRYYINFFMPVVKLKSKTRTGSRVIKRYDLAKTPFRRVLASPYIEDSIKKKLKRQYDMINPAELKSYVKYPVMWSKNQKSLVWWVFTTIVSNLLHIIKYNYNDSSQLITSLFSLISCFKL